jgi:2'-5' RNA ligase
MKLAVIAYPVLSDDDRRWIEDIRTAHDPQSTRVAAHFTLVFPADIRADPVVKHVEFILREFERISFVLRQALVVRDLVGQGAHVFLVPDQGEDEITRLHDRLYSEFLEPYRRKNMPFVPHVTVAAIGDFGTCESLADRLNEERREISGQITGVDVVETDAPVRTVAHLKLAARGSMR